MSIIYIHAIKKKEGEEKGIPQKEAQKTQSQNTSARRKSQKKVGEEEAQSNDWKLEKVKGKVKRREV